MSASCAVIVAFLALVQTTEGQTAPGDPRSEQNLRLVTWNIQGCARGLHPVLNILRQQNADIICLQEAEVGTGRTESSHQAALIAKNLGLHYVSAGSAFATGGEQHMAILSREPIEKLESLDTGTGRIYAVTALTSFRGKPVRIISVHLTNRYWRGFKNIMSTGNAPVREAADLARRIRDWKEPVILAGDFNAIPGMREHDSIARQLSRVPTTQPTYPADKPALAVDHIYHCAAFRAAQFVIPESGSSDHRPLIASLSRSPAESRPHLEQQSRATGGRHR